MSRLRFCKKKGTQKLDIETSEKLKKLWMQMSALWALRGDPLPPPRRLWMAPKFLISSLKNKRIIGHYRFRFLVDWNFYIVEAL